VGWRQLGPKKNLTSCPGLVDHYTAELDEAGTILQVAAYMHLNFRRILNDRNEGAGGFHHSLIY
jgi:hypothetical protein